MESTLGNVEAELGGVEVEVVLEPGGVEVEVVLELGGVEVEVELGGVEVATG